MTDDFKRSLFNSQGMQRALQHQLNIDRQREQFEEISRSMEESSQEIAREKEEEKWLREEHLEASQITASRLDDVTRGLRDVAGALQGVHDRLDQQNTDSKDEGRKNRKVSWLSFSVGALAAVAAIGVPFIVQWMQSGG